MHLYTSAEDKSLHIVCLSRVVCGTLYIFDVFRYPILFECTSQTAFFILSGFHFPYLVEGDIASLTLFVTPSPHQSLCTVKTQTAPNKIVQNCVGVLQNLLKVHFARLHFLEGYFARLARTRVVL